MARLGSPLLNGTLMRKEAPLWIGGSLLWTEDWPRSIQKNQETITMATTKIGIIGDGNVGGALARGLKRAGHDVRAIGKDKQAIREVAGWAEMVVLAVPFGAIDDVVQTAGEALAGKTVVDVTNVVGPDMGLAVGFNTSGAEELQKKIPRARVVKAFNTVFAQHMDSGRLGDQRLTAFVASDDGGAKQSVLELARDVGFDALDAGPLKNARLIEPLAILNIQLGYGLEMGSQIGFKLLHS
jgi:predicted dinucleotide-binding enzyme